ncbi:hypothetical protein C7405_12048 [Paraburkholderia caballeronis]|nr:hypothetical protein C7405_12048 [Paraburkholderia caballeronis]
MTSSPSMRAARSTRSRATWPVASAIGIGESGNRIRSACGRARLRRCRRAAAVLESGRHAARYVRQRDPWRRGSADARSGGVVGHAENRARQAELRAGYPPCRSGAIPMRCRFPAIRRRAAWAIRIARFSSTISMPSILQLSGRESKPIRFSATGRTSILSASLIAAASGCASGSGAAAYRSGRARVVAVLSSAESGAVFWTIPSRWSAMAQR